MISVSRKDWRDRSIPVPEMEETELEEGEARNYHRGNEDSAVYPDINSLSYIGEKVQSVLGHLQKDFEGLVSVENLGAKFGDYGSFLPTYQRPPEAVHSSQKSPRKERKPNALSSVAASPAWKSNAVSGEPASTRRVSSIRDKLQSGNADKSTAKSGRNEKPINSLKLRIKVGSENLLTKKNVDIYNGLGLVSPSSSLDGSPATSERGHHKITNMPDESPTSILKIMTSFPVDVLLSPLSEDLIHLNTMRGGKHESQRTARTRMSTEKSALLINGFHSCSSNEKAPQEKKSSATEIADQINSIEDKIVTPLRKEQETNDDDLLCEDASNALKPRHFSSSEYFSRDPGKEMPFAPSLRDGRVGNSARSLGSSCNVSEYDKHKSLSANAAAPSIVSQIAEVPHPLDQPEVSGSKLKKTCSGAELPDMSKQLVFHNRGSVRTEDVKPSVELSQRDKKKLKAAKAAGSQGACSRKDESAVGLAMAHKDEKSADARFADLKNDSHEPKKEKEKTANRYKDFFGDEELDDDEDDNESLSGELTSAGRLKEHHLPVRRSFSKDHNMSKEGNPQSKEKYPRIGSHPANPVVNGISTDAPTGLKPMVNEDWVSCDLCHIWRLLPLGTDPKSLPEKWTCSMLSWLPGMNRCYIPEEHTTNALRALYQPSVVLPGPISEVTPMGAAAGYPDQEHPSIAVKTTSNGKKKNGSTKATNSTVVDGSTHSSSSKKKTLITTGKGSNLSGGNSSPSTDAGRYQFSGRSSSGTEKFEHRKRKLSVVSCPERGIHISLKSKRDDVDASKASKRIRSEERHFDDEKMVGNNEGSSLKGGKASISENERHKIRNHVSAVDKKNLVSDVQTEAYAPGTENNASVHSGKRNEKDTIRKRKSKEHRDPESHLEKKLRASKSTKGSNVETGRKSEVPKHELHAAYADNNQASDYLKSEMGQLQPLAAANSSSSKVSGSHKNSAGGQEAKGSPVESVSSSPLRYPDAGKVSSTVKNLVGKFDVEDSRTLTAVIPRRLLDDGGSNGQTEMRKNEALACAGTLSGFNGHLSRNAQVSAAKNLSDQRKVDGSTNTGQSQHTGLHLKKSGKHSKATSKASDHDFERVSNRVLDSSHDSMDRHQSYEEKSKSRKNKHDDKSGTTSRGEKSITRKEAAGGTPNDNTKAQGRRIVDDGQDAMKRLDKGPGSREHDTEKLSQKSKFSEVHGNTMSNPLPPLARINTETAINHVDVSGSQKDKVVNISAADASESGNTQKAQGEKINVENSNCPPFRLSNPNSHKVRDADGSSPVRRESSSHVANSIVKEATVLKHTADRMKNSGSLEGISLYIQASLKFLHGASLMELTGREANKHNELMNSMNIYSSTAKLCEYCAREYEKSEDMAAAALAYKCVEVAYMRVVYSNNHSASRDRNELQSALQIAAPGESPSSSASDVDNLNHQSAGAPEKGTLARVGGSPHVSGGHVISSRNRACFTHLLDFAQNANFAMEASKKSRLAFATALSRLSETSNEEALSSLRKALDYTFLDVEGFLRLVRLAMEALNS